MDNTELRTTWCRMWGEDSALAYALMTEGAVQWSGQTPGLDAVVGPAQQQRFATAYREKSANTFTPRVLADGGERFAYTWDVRLPDGQVWTGLDVDVVKDGRIDENWTLVAPRRCALADPAPIAATVEELREVGDRWLRLWDGASALADDLIAADMSVFFGPPDAAADDLRGPKQLSALVQGRRATAGGPKVSLHREPVLDTARGLVAVLWTAGEDGVGGADLLAVDEARVTQAWSFTATRPFRY